MRRDVRSSFVFALSVLLLLLGSFLLQPVGRVASAQKRPADEIVIARINVRSQQELERLVALGLDLLETREGDDLFVMTSPAQLGRLREQGWRVSVDEKQTALVRGQRPDLRQTRAQNTQPGTAQTGTTQLSASSFMGGYLTVPEMRAFLEDRATQYPNLAEFLIYGESWERVSGGPGFGHDLFGIKLTNKQNVTTEPKPTFFLMAAIHARELSTSELALRFVDHLLNGYGVDADATWLLDEHTVVVVPVANPDGRRLAELGQMHRKNTNNTNGGPCLNPPDAFSHVGIDLNRNHDFKWGTVDMPTIDPCSQTYPGPSVSSEPETQALQNLVRSLIPDQRGPLDTDAARPDTKGVLITLHSYANLVMWPWGHTANPAPDGAGLALIGGKFAGYNGYTPQQANQLYPSSGKTDEWAYGELGIPAYVFEVGIGEGECGGFMPPYSCLDGGYEGSFWPRNLPAFLYAARIARAPYQLAHGPSPEAIAAIPSATAGVFELRAQLDEQRNGGQTIVAAEYYLDTPPWEPGSTPVPMTAADGNFNGTVEFVTANVGPLTGTHTLYVRGQDASGNWGPVRAVFSPPESCAYGISPATQSFTASAGAGVVNVTAPSGCGWTATVNGGAGWINITSGGLGGGNGTVNYTVAANSGTAPRSATLTVAGQTYTVTQGAVQLDTLSPNPATVAGGQSSVGTVTLDAPAPTGGVVVALSSDNAAVATVPASVTVAAGVSSQTFGVTTQAVAADTTANISATYAGATRTALLTVARAAVAPSNLRATAPSSKRTIDLSWTDNSNNETGFRIERCTGATCTNFTLLTTVNANTINYRNSGLVSGTAYRYRVRANASAGYSVYSNIAGAQAR